MSKKQENDSQESTTNSEVFVDAKIINKVKEAVSSVDGVTQVSVLKEPSRKGILVGVHGKYSNAEIATAIKENLPDGIRTVGNITENGVNFDKHCRD